MNTTTHSAPADDGGKQAAKPAAKSPRRRAREFALQGLYQWRLSGNDEAAIEAHLADIAGFDKADRDFFVGLLRGVLAQHGALQEQLQALLDRPFAELSPVESSVLLAGAYELAKGYGGTDGHKYVNGVLDKLAAKLRPAEVEAKRAARRT